MFLSVFCFFLLNTIAQTNADYVQNITLRINGSLNGTSFLYCNASEEYILLEGEPADVILVHGNKNIDGNCHHFNNKNYKYLKESFESHGNIHKSKVSTQDIKGRQFVRFKEPLVTTKVNDTTLSISRTDPSVSEYDAMGFFDFVVGETISVVCEEGSNMTASSLEYNFYNNKDEHVLKTGNNIEKHSSFQATLKSEHNNGYWECIYIDLFSKNKDRYVVRIYLRLQTSIDVPELVIISSGACAIIAIIILIVCCQLRSYKRQVNNVNYCMNCACNPSCSTRSTPGDRPEYIDSTSDTYAVVYSKSVCSYMPPLPKNQLYINTSENSNVHNIKPDHGGMGKDDEKIADIREEDVAYAEVPPKSGNGAGGKKYANVCTSDRYVNTDANEYAEPAYCQAVIKD